MSCVRAPTKARRRRSTLRDTWFSNFSVTRCGGEPLDTVYVAETDEDGDVQFVWIAKNGRRTVRPFDPTRHKFHPDTPAEYSGAQKAAIASWMTAQQHGF